MENVQRWRDYIYLRRGMLQILNVLQNSWVFEQISCLELL